MAHYTPAQYATIKNYIDSVPELASQPLDGDGLGVCRDALNAASSPAFIVWRTNVRSTETGNAWLGTDIAAMISLNIQRLQLMLASSTEGIFDMSRSDRRAGFEDPFGTNVNNGSRVAMRAVWKRTASVLEKLFATGTGSDASPGTMVIEEKITKDEVDIARRS